MKYAVVSYSTIDYNDQCDIIKKLKSFGYTPVDVQDDEVYTNAVYCNKGYYSTYPEDNINYMNISEESSNQTLARAYFLEIANCDDEKIQGQWFKDAEMGYVVYIKYPEFLKNTDIRMSVKELTKWLLKK